MTRVAQLHERGCRTAPASCFSGGHVGHGKIVSLPMEEPSFFDRLFGGKGRAMPSVKARAATASQRSQRVVSGKAGITIAGRGE